MRSNELMIGDYVQVNDEVYKVISILYFDIGISDDKKDFYHEYIDNIKPISVTTEILEKIGFWHEHNVGYVMEEGEYEIIYDLWDHKLRILKNREQILNLEYWNEMCVHELQHALRLCNIDKEIEI